VLSSAPFPSESFFDAVKGILIYLLVYTFMNIGAFAVITSLRHRNIAGDDLDDLNGLYSRAPVESVLMLVFMVIVGVLVMMMVMLIMVMVIMITGMMMSVRLVFVRVMMMLMPMIMLVRRRTINQHVNFR